MQQNIKQSLSNNPAAAKTASAHWSSILSRPKSILRSKQQKNSRELVDALINQQWQRERAKFESIVQYNNPYYSGLKNYASQF